ncbi:MULTISPECIES: deoxyribose-phosphate aldolase [Anaerotruncus]|jgi:deoxyribose-phosphate aldolase|uniref:deoxyribose-phosphate aldolase n=1 Tax=Anaerotruncus TaxID=244127 RepID=UPI000835C654|nr:MULTISPECIES: deoxyribose-phosphate aldolase [Anaerotruncus]RGX55901.1 deoxyribose-phosphate aldolase [Anaerotruncus sp. AF02-27]
MNVTRNDVERIIDASLGATPAPTLDQVSEFVKKTLDYNFATTLTEPFFIKYNADILHAAGKQLVSVISYPLYGMTHEAKLAQAKQALADGADELDVSMDISAFKSGRFDYVKEDLKPFVDLMEGRIMKMIYGATLLTEDEQKHAAEIAIELGIPFLKTNTGYGYVTTIEQVKLIKDNFGDDIKVMVSGGVRTKEDAIAMIEAGAARIATSSPFKIVDSFNA